MDDGALPQVRTRAPLARVVDGPFSPEAELAAFMTGRVEMGACVSFVGLVRGGDVQALELQHYPGFTEAELERLARGVLARTGAAELMVVHRVGRMRPGEPIVLAAALSPHRVRAFRAVEEIMDLLKTEAPFWKREWRADGAHWIEPTAEDVARNHARLETP